MRWPCGLTHAPVGSWESEVAWADGLTVEYRKMQTLKHRSCSMIEDFFLNFNGRIELETGAV
jgi:hypothetical protein